MSKATGIRCPVCGGAIRVVEVTVLYWFVWCVSCTNLWGRRRTEKAAIALVEHHILASARSVERRRKREGKKR
ncbi:MAG: hypothetical protein ACHREM_19230 [Polyangiales bacterium]